MTGETLAKRLERGAVPLDEALRIGIAIGEALDQAHRRGVVHGDLTAANILLAEAGPKLLDSGSDGRDSDARTDIFAFGGVLRAMTSDRRALPPALDHVVTTCLARDPDDRWQTARDLVAELRWIAGGSGVIEIAAAPPETGASGFRVRRALLAIAGVLIAALAVPAVLFVRGGPPPERMEIRVTTAPLNYSNNTTNLGFAISPDGRRLVLAARPNAALPSLNVPYSLYVGTVDFLSPVHLTGTDQATSPFWSPDGREIGFVANGKLMKIEATGGPARPICDAPEFRGGTWNRDGTILFGSRAGILRVPSEGGTPALVTAPEPTEAGHMWPRFLPDGRQFLFLAVASEGASHALMAGALDSKDKKRIMSLDSHAEFTSGYLVFGRETSMYAQRFDPDSLVLSGEPTRLGDGLPRRSGTRGPFAVSHTGVLVYYRDLPDPSDVLPPRARPEQEWQLSWISRTGQDAQTVGKPGVYRGVEVSRDGTRIAVHRHDPNGGDVWVFGPGGTETRITFDASQDNSNPVWSTDGSRVTYASLRSGKWGLYQAASDGSGKEELLLESELPKVPLQWSPDGKYLLFWVRDPKTADDLWVWPAADRKARPLIATDAIEQYGQISPDGKWIAYSSSHESRRHILVRPFPAGNGQWQVSPDRQAGATGTILSGSGAWPRWSQTTNELFYLSAEQGSLLPRTLYSATWRANGSSFTHGPPVAFLQINALQYPHDGGDYHTYAVSPDARRILQYQAATTATPTPTVSETPDPRNGLTVIMNWVQGLKK